MQQIENQSGRVFWITGLAGAGKTTIARLFYEHLKREGASAVLLDGDSLREVFNDASYTQEGRFNLAMKYGRLCRLLANQGIDVVCATISMFDECRNWNRSHLPRYTEIYLRASLEVLKQRDQKSLYSAALNAKTSDVVGVDLPFEEPKNPHLIIDNNGCETPTTLCERIVQYLKEKDQNETR